MFFYSLVMLLMVNLTSLAVQNSENKGLVAKYYSPKINNISLYKVVDSEKGIEVFEQYANSPVIAKITRKDGALASISWHPEGTHLLVIQKRKDKIVDLSVVDLFGREVSKIPYSEIANHVNLSDSGYKIFIGKKDTEDDGEPGKVVDWNGAEQAVATYSDWLDMLGIEDDTDFEDDQD